MHTSLRPYRFVLAVLVGVLAVAGTAGAACVTKKAPPSKNCAKAIVDDWYPDGDVDFVYPLTCYQQAIKSLPNDLREYSQAPDDIQRAFRFAKKGCSDPGRGGTTSRPTTTDTGTTDTGTTDTGKTDTGKTDTGKTDTGKTDTGKTDTGKTDTGKTDTGKTDTDTTDTDFGTVGGGGVGGPSGDGGGATDGDTGDSSSVPVPLIVLGGLAVLLFAAGGAGYLSRRSRGQVTPEDDPQSSP